MQKESLRFTSIAAALQSLKDCLALNTEQRDFPATIGYYAVQNTGKYGMPRYVMVTGGVGEVLNISEEIAWVLSTTSLHYRFMYDDRYSALAWSSLVDVATMEYLLSEAVGFKVHLRLLNY